MPGALIAVDSTIPAMSATHVQLRGARLGRGGDLARRATGSCTTSCPVRPSSSAGKTHPLAPIRLAGYFARASRGFRRRVDSSSTARRTSSSSVTDALRLVPSRRDGHVRRAGGARRPSERTACRGIVLRAQPFLDRRPLPPRRGGRRARLVRLARGRVQATAAGARRCRCLRSCGTSWPGSSRNGTATGSRSSPGSRTRPGSLHLHGPRGDRAPARPREPRPRRVARSASCASSASRRRSARTSGARSDGRRATSCMSRVRSRALEVLRGGGCRRRRLAPLERPPKRVVARACCRAAYLRGALLGGGTLSGPRSPHLEVRTATVEGAEFVAVRRRASRGAA